MKKEYDWNRHNVEHLERIGCLIKIREGSLANRGREVTSVEIIPDSGRRSDGSRVIKETEADEKKQDKKA